MIPLKENVPWLPLPNRLELVLTREEAPRELTATAFLLPVHEDRSVTLAVNTRRGIEIPGGHVEAEETLLEAAIRECLEEAGCEVEDVVPLGYIEMTSQGTIPDDWPYPHPLSYQQFYAGRVVRVHQVIAGDECLEPTRVSDHQSNRPEFRFLKEAAIGLLFP